MLPGQYATTATTINTWSDFARILGVITGLEDALKDYFNLNWLQPISQMSLLYPIRNKDINNWFTQSLRREDTTDLATIAQNFLKLYKSTVLVSIKNATGNKDSMIPVAEPGIKTLQMGNNDGFSTLSKDMDVRNRFNMYMADVIDTLHRIHPNSW